MVTVMMVVIMQHMPSAHLAPIAPIAEHARSRATLVSLSAQMNATYSPEMVDATMVVTVQFTPCVSTGRTAVIVEIVFFPPT